MLERSIESINEYIGKTNLAKRFIFKEISNFINSAFNLEGNILVLYGLRRTGKTTLLEQAISDFSETKKCCFIEIQESDDIEKITQKLIEERKKGTTLICIDEITKAQDFITNCAVLSDIFAKEGMKIIVTGTDSLGFVFANNSELYDRAIFVNSTYISFYEHSEILHTNDIDDYIMYGGLMKKGLDNNRIIYDYQSACKYLDSAVVDNISKSIKKSCEDNCLNILTNEELKIIIKKLVESYSGKFNPKIIQESLKKVSLNYIENKYIDVLDTDIIDYLLLEKKNITSAYLKEINLDQNIKHKITLQMVDVLERYLLDMEVLSAIPKIEIILDENIGLSASAEQHEYYMIQPAIKYHHLNKAKNFINEKPFYNRLNLEAKVYLQKKLQEKIFGDMTEQIITYNVQQEFDSKLYKVIKPFFYEKKSRIGEFDMLIYDLSKNICWTFEIKHTTNSFIKQTQHLTSLELKSATESYYGRVENSAVLYRGNSFISEGSGIFYLNFLTFLKKVHCHKDLEKVFEDFSKELEVMAVPTEMQDSGTTNKLTNLSIDTNIKANFVK